MNFTIDITPEEKEILYERFDKIFETNQLTEGKYTEEFESKFSSYIGAKAVATSSWTGAAMAILEFLEVRGKTILLPSNTFMATPLVALKLGAKIEFVDCNKYDLCMSVEDLEIKIKKFKPKVVIVVHIGGHIAFDILDIVSLCKKHNIALIEDCAHAHGAEYRGKKAGTFGIAGAYSFYATKTITTGEGGMLVTNNNDLIEYAKRYRNYGKFDYKVHGLNFRINEFTAALGIWQIEKLSKILEWKHMKAKKYDKIHSKRLILPKSMKSGYYKYIVFEPIDNSTGKVYDQPCHKILCHKCELPNTDWVAKNHWCVPLFYKGE